LDSLEVGKQINDLPADTINLPSNAAGADSDLLTKQDPKITQPSSPAPEKELSIKEIISNHPEDGMQKEIQNLLLMIKSYQPEELELESKLFPFIPGYIPSAGDIDPMIKISSTGDHDKIGLIMIDEPSSVQSNPAGIRVLAILLLVRMSIITVLLVVYTNAKCWIYNSEPCQNNQVLHLFDISSCTSDTTLN
jgi:hypothetical protein